MMSPMQHWLLPSARASLGLYVSICVMVRAGSEDGECYLLSLPCEVGLRSRGFLDTGKRLFMLELILRF